MDWDRQTARFREHLARAVGQFGRHAKVAIARDAARHRTQLEVGMFRSVDAALAWAYRTAARDIIKISALGTWRGAEKPGSTLTPQEMHGGAAQVLGHVRRLPDLEQANVHARYWPSRLDGGGQDPSYRAAIEMLARSIMGTQGTGLHSWRGAVLVVKQFYEGEKGGIRAVRKAEEVGQAKAVESRNAAWDRLTLINNRATGELETSLQEAGWLERYE